MLEELGVSVTVADARFCKPLDTELVRQLADNHAALVTVEEGSIGGFASHVTQYMLSSGLLDGSLKLRCMHLPDANIEHGSHDWQLEQAGLSPKDIAATVLQLLDRYGNRSASRHMHKQRAVCCRLASRASGFAFSTMAEVLGLKRSSSDRLVSALHMDMCAPLAGSGKRWRCLRRSKLRRWRRRPWLRHCGRRGQAGRERGTGDDGRGNVGASAWALGCTPGCAHVVYVMCMTKP